MLTALQISNRTTGIGGSEAAAACGISPWKSPLQVYLEKRGELPPFQGNTKTEWGERLEGAIRQKYAEDTGRVVRLPADTFRSPEHAYMLCHPDGIAEHPTLTDEPLRLYEGKNTERGDRWGDPGTDDIPEEHLIQVQHNMFVLGLVVADVAVLISGNDYRRYEVRADRELQDMLVAKEGELWTRIERGDPPPVTTTEDARLLFGARSIANKVEADKAVHAAYLELLDYEERAQVLAEMIDHRKAQLQAALGENDTLVRGRDTLATWKLDGKGRESIDVTLLRTQLPDVAARYTKTTPPVRRFLLKRGNS